MNGWYYFWMANFVLAGSAFAMITVIVLVRGLRDLREMFAGLARRGAAATMIGTHFSGLDWVIVIGYLAATMATGLYGRKFVGGISDFLVAGRELGTFLAVATLAATEIGTITFMYYAELGYKTGYASFVNGLIAGLVMIFLGRTGFIVERLRAMKLMTVPEFFQVKFSRNLRVFVGVLVAVGGILNMGVFLRIEGTFLAIISGISLSHIKAVMSAILLLELVYTVLGGMVSIVITDFIQFVALSIGTILVTIWSVHAAGLSQHVQRGAAERWARAGSIRSRIPITAGRTLRSRC